MRTQKYFNLNSWEGPEIWKAVRVIGPTGNVCIALTFITRKREAKYVVRITEQEFDELTKLDQDLRRKVIVRLVEERRNNTSKAKNVIRLLQNEPLGEINRKIPNIAEIIEQEKQGRSRNVIRPFWKRKA